MHGRKLGASFFMPLSEAFSQLYQICKMVRFAEIINALESCQTSLQKQLTAKNHKLISQIALS